MAREVAGSVAVATIAICSAALGCPTVVTFECISAEHCDLEDGGVCQPDGRCSYPDDACASRQRYAAPSGAAAECVPEATDTDTSSPSSTGGEDTGDDDTGNDDTGDDDTGDDDTGTPLWGDGELYDHAGRDDKGYGLAIADDGRFAVVGFVTDENGEQDSFLQLRDPDGAVLWTHVVDNLGVDVGEQVLFGEDGDLFACGVQADATSGFDQGWVRRFATGDGEEIWASVLARPGGSWIKDCHGLADGTIAIAGIDGTIEDPRGLIGRIDATGTMLWQHPHGEPAPPRAELTGITTDVDGSLVVGGRLGVPDDEWLALLLGYDVDGVLLWEAPLGVIQGPAQECFGVGHDANGVFAMGRVFGDVQGNDAWLAYYQGGMREWWDTLSGPGSGSEEFHRLVAHEDGDLVVVGSQGGVGHDILVIRFDPALHARWTHDHGGTGRHDDKAWDVGFAPDGTILVAGYVTTADSGIDVWLQRYTP